MLKSAILFWLAVLVALAALIVVAWSVAERLDEAEARLTTLETVSLGAPQVFTIPVVINTSDVVGWD